MFQNDINSHGGFGDVLVVLNQATGVGGASEIPNGDILIEVKRDEETVATTHITDNDGFFEYTLLFGEYEVVASFLDQDGNKWNCVNTIKLDKTQEILIVPCFPTQHLFIPNVNR